MESQPFPVVGIIIVLVAFLFFIGVPLFGEFALWIGERSSRKDRKTEKKRHIEIESFDAISRRADKEFRARRRRVENERRSGWESGRGYTPER